MISLKFRHISISPLIVINGKWKLLWKAFHGDSMPTCQLGLRLTANSKLLLTNSLISRFDRFWKFSSITNQSINLWVIFHPSINQLLTLLIYHLFQEEEEEKAVVRFRHLSKKICEYLNKLLAENIVCGLCGINSIVLRQWISIIDLIRSSSKISYKTKDQENAS